ncbi:Leucine-rich repeat protein kinase family protein [Abeliophyllum distichum]|uniref:Leucine-rich repeat protein kinase family protein n=1 Tax=Abeliophyllum distichum TaxID=126358 RepID=A0ABD1U333_9LAMI
MENSWIHFTFLVFGVLFFLLYVPVSNAQLAPAESRILFQVQQLLEFPPVLQTWNNWTSFCYLPQTPFLVIKLSLVSLGLWGPLPDKVNRFQSLSVLNFSSNFIYSSIPPSIANFQNLRSLVFSNNLLNGSVPALKGLKVLEELDLSNNHLGPKFPSLGNSLIRVALGNNSLRSEIPRNFKTFHRLQILSIPSCKLIGPIPSFLFSLPSILYINLAKNQFSGALSTNVSCNGDLTFVDISNNLLIGNLPSCLGSNTKDKTVISTWNCLSNTTTKYQRPYTFCHKEALAVHPPARNQENSTLKLGILLGIIGGIIAILGAFGLLILAIFRKVQQNRANDYKCDSFVIEKTSVRSSPIGNGRHVPQSMQLTSLGLPPYHVFSLEEMEDATNNFDPSNLVGEGLQGQVYKGRLRDGSVVLVKCLKLKQKHSPQALQQHMEVISKLRHRHLVSVLGHCIVTYQGHPNTASTVFIVLENIYNGSLRDLLSDWRKREVLKWPQRMAITMGIARGIQYLHTGGVQGNDLKTETILLDESLTAKISNYNLALLSKGGAEGPENPEKDDIYRLGVILIEVITGRPKNSQSELDDLKFQVERRLAESPSELRGLIDPSIRGTFAYESLKTVVQITMNCLCKDSSMRPSVEDVLWHMQYSVQVQEGWTGSGNLSGNLIRNLGNSQ